MNRPARVADGTTDVVPSVTTPAAPPRWFLLLPLCALLAWWPIGSYWQSDDFLAVHYARDLGNVLRDFVGPQYGATDVWLFYRPLITASFWLDQQLGGAEPFVAHLGNVLAHAASALLGALLWRRFLPDGRAFAAALLWTILPGHVGSLAWAVGRVDSHTTVWILGALLAFVRHCERSGRGERTRRWPHLLLTGLALLSKELAFVLPPLATLLAAVLAPPQPLARRLGTALRRTAPMWLLFGGYLLWRLFVLGRLGGYLAAAVDPAATLRGLAQFVADTLVPWRWAHDVGAIWLWLAALPVLLAAFAAATRPRLLGGAVLTFLIACAPLLPFLADAGNPHNLRYLYLPSLALAGLCAARHAALPLLAAACCVLPLASVRTAQFAADRESAAMHTALLREVADGERGPMFVAGMPHANARGTAVQLHFGVDRMLEPPFGPGGVALYALRPLAETPGVFRLAGPGEAPFALPEGSTWFFAGASALGRAPETLPLPELVVDGDGVLDFGSARLLALATEGLDFGLRTHPGRPACFRLTVFTANGYLACVFTDHGPADADHGTLDARQLLAGSGTAIARYGPAPGAVLGEAMVVPTTIDRSVEFPTLLEAGDWSDGGFVPKLRARRLLRLRFDRGYPAWVRLVQGRG